MWGNTFMNMFLLGLVEGPGNVLGVLMADKLGRRWTHFSLLALSSALFLAIIPVVKMSGQEDRWWAEPVTAFFCMFIKFNISASFVVAYVQVKFGFICFGVNSGATWFYSFWHKLRRNFVLFDLDYIDVKLWLIC